MNDNNNNEFENENEVKQEPNNKPNFDDFSYAKNTKKALIPMFIGLFTMVLLTVGATWAFYNVQITNTSKSLSVSTSMGAQNLVTISGGGASLSLNLSAENMSQTTASTGGKVWWASANGVPGASEYNANVATATLTTGQSATCTYTLKIIPTTKTLYTAYQLLKDKAAGEIVLKVNNVTYDLYNADTNLSAIFGNGLTLTGQTMNFAKNGESKSITASFKFTNTTKDQSSLAGTGIALTISTEAWSCK